MNLNSSTPLVDSNTLDSLTQYRRLQSQTVSNSFQPQSRDQFGGISYNRNNATIANLSTPIGASAIASGNRSTAVGAFAYAKEDSAVGLGVYALALGPSSVALGDQSKATAYRGIAIGSYCYSSGVNAVSVGIASRATAQQAVSIGNNSSASGAQAVAIGKSASAQAQSVAIGNTATAASLGVAIGFLSVTVGSACTAVGELANCNVSNGATAIGASAGAAGANATAVGTAAVGSATGGVAIGQSANTLLLKTDSIAIGHSSQAQDDYGIALGSSANSAHSQAVALGKAATTTAANQMMIGDSTAGLDVVVNNGTLSLTTVGKGFALKRGTNATFGIVTLSGAGTAIIYSTKIGTTDQIILSPMNASGTAGAVYISTSTNTVSATVASTNAADTRDVYWQIVKPS